MDLVSAAIILFLIMDPVGNLPIFSAALRAVEPRRRKWVLLREMVIALGILYLFLFFGERIFGLLNLTRPALSISGGVVLFLIALRMIFPGRRGAAGMVSDGKDGEPLIVPLAMPLIAGPGAIAMVMLFASRDPGSRLDIALAVGVAWAASTAILVVGDALGRFIPDKAHRAIERLMGMIIITMAVQMLLDGTEGFLKSAGVA